MSKGVKVGNYLNKELIVNNKGTYDFSVQGLQLIKNELNNGKSYVQLSKIFDVNPDTLSKICKKYNIDRDNRRKFQANEQFFSSISSPEQAYWLGFLYADGYINENRGVIRLTLQELDKQHLEKFKRALQSNKTIKSVISYNKYKSYYVDINSRNMVNDLVKLGCFQNKSLSLKPPTNNQVPLHLVKYWILGYYDGDGGICMYDSNRYKSYFTATYEIISFICQYFNFNNKISREHRCTNNTFRVSFAETKTVRMLNELYDNNSIDFCLERKYQKFLSIKKIITHAQSK